MSINFYNNWITPPDFEGPVNQGHEIVGADGKVESDQQYRGLRWWHQRWRQPHGEQPFHRHVKRPDGSAGYVGYGIDSLTVGLAAICRVNSSAQPAPAWPTFTRRQRKPGSRWPSSTRRASCVT